MTNADKFLVEWWPIDRPKPYQTNPRQNLASVEKVAASIREFGWRQPIVVDRFDVIVAGDTRWRAAQKLGLTKVPVHPARDLTEDQCRAYRLADNRVGDDSAWDEELLAIELAALRDRKVDLAITGFDAAELEKLLEETTSGSRLPDPNARPATPARPITRIGDVWLLGPHRVRCGDARRQDDLRSATLNTMADLIWIDPPMFKGRGRPSNARHRGGEAQQSLQLEHHHHQQFLLAAFRNLAKVARPGAPAYVAHHEADGLDTRQAFEVAGFAFGSVLIWLRDRIEPTRGDYQTQHQPILYGWRPGAAHPWKGGRKKSALLDVPREIGFEELPDGRWQIARGDELLLIEGKGTLEQLTPGVVRHPRARKVKGFAPEVPPAVIERTLQNSAERGALVLDSFGGAGATVIACERVGMRACVVEADPAAVDVIVRRWEEYTQRKALREVDRKPFSPKRSPAKGGTKAPPRETKRAKPETPAAGREAADKNPAPRANGGDEDSRTQEPAPRPSSGDTDNIGPQLEEELNGTAH